MINVTKTYLPPLDEYMRYLEGVWARNHVTNFGPLVLELETRLKEYLGVKHLFYVSNGTIALQIAVKALDLKGEVITTPFSYVATTSSIVWEGCHPVFVDIDPHTLCIDPGLLEDAITPSTSAILPTHVYGYPCDVKKIQEIAARHNIKVIYDAAHAFGVRYKNVPLVNFGDISTLSFHATKLFHTVEGGAVVTNNDELAERIGYLMNFGHKSESEFSGVGINGKNSELHAAMGLCILPRIPELIARRKEICDLYDLCLSNANLVKPYANQFTDFNYAYYPVIFPSENVLLRVINALKAQQIFPRRYFYPSLNMLNYINPWQNMPIAEDISRRILCLPLSNYLTNDEVLQISRIALESLAA